MPVMEIFGKASGTSRFLEYSPEEIETNLLIWLRSHGITIASSCDGVGVCKKCGIQNGWMSCELTLKTFLERCPEGKIIINYL